MKTVEKEITINILGKEYSLVSDQEDYVRSLELCVNDLLRKLRQDNPTVPYSKLLVLACMYLADEMLKSKKSAKMFLNSLSGELQRIVSENEKVLRLAAQESAATPDAGEDCAQKEEEI